MIDPRITTLAKNLINYSVSLKKGEKVLIEAVDVPSEFVCELVREAHLAGGLPFVNIIDTKVQRALLNGTNEAHNLAWANYDKYRMSDMQAYIGIRGGVNSFELSDVPAANKELHSRLYSHPVHHEIRVAKTKWVVLRYPNNSMAQLAQTSTEDFEDFYFSVCNLDYSKMERAMTPLKELMDKTDKVRIVAKDTDISFSIKGIGSKKCCGYLNIPDGEIYSAPVKNSVNGRITYNTPSLKDGIKHENVSFLFKDGKIIEATGSHTKELNAVLDTDEGARYIGEFALGFNPFIIKPMCDTLFDEKIDGSIHFTPGACYEQAYNGNNSAIHWDLVQIQTPEYGGGEIYFDGVLIRKDGRFVVKELLGLNPENLK